MYRASPRFATNILFVSCSPIPAAQTRRSKIISMTGTSDAVAVGWQHYQAGRLAQAEAAARTSLATDPNGVRALDLLGSVYLARGRHAEGVALLRQAVERKPDFAQAHDHL